MNVFDWTPENVDVFINASVFVALPHGFVSNRVHLLCNAKLRV